MKMQITIEKLEAILYVAKNYLATDNGLSNTLEFELIKSKDTHLGSDTIRVEQKSGYGDCSGKFIV